MLLTVQKFILFSLISMLIVIYTIFAKHYLSQKEETAQVIFTNINNTMSEISYIISKNITNDLTVDTSRAILDRTASNNKNISAILIINDNDIVITTDPHYNTAPIKSRLYNDKTLSVYKRLVIKDGVEGKIRFYKGKTPQQLRLVVLFDHEEINSHFVASNIHFAIYLGVLPLLLLLIAWIISRYMLSIPLEKLRQFAYYQSEIPKAFKLKELEAIRSSMVQTFSRLKDEQKELYMMARTDSLSGLANRNSLDEYLKRLISDSALNHKEFAFLFLDIDNFKTVNDELGHAIGDELLKKISSKVQTVIPNDFVARVGGDEFVILLQQYHSISELTETINHIQKSITDQWLIQSNPISLTSSLGIAFYPKDAIDAISLMQHSSIAMQEAKKNGRAQYHFYTEELNKKVQDTIALDKAMRNALDNNEYELYYQPKTDVQSGKIIGVEALIRWISPTDGLIPPNVFIPLAEENGFIVEIGTWVLKEAIYQQVKWKNEGLDITISINVATKQLLNSNFEYIFTSLLQESKVDPSKIDIEITEYLFLESTQNTLNILNSIKNKNVTISLDDFGTGYSSLSYLKKFPIDNLKIDKVFMDDYNSPEGAIFVETIVKMGQTLKMNIIAEGIEEKEQVNYLNSIGCPTYQGYYCSKPLSVKDFKLFYQLYTTR